MRTKCIAAILALGIVIAVSAPSVQGADLAGTWTRNGTSILPPFIWQDTAEFAQFLIFYTEIALPTHVSFYGVTVGNSYAGFSFDASLPMLDFGTIDATGRMTGYVFNTLIPVIFYTGVKTTPSVLSPS